MILFNQIQILLLGRGGYGGGRGYGRWDHLNYFPDSHLKTKKQIGAIDPR